MEFSLFSTAPYASRREKGQEMEGKANHCIIFETEFLSRSIIVSHSRLLSRWYFRETACGWIWLRGGAYSRNPRLLDTGGHWASVKGAPEEWSITWFRALILCQGCLAPWRHLATSAVIWLLHLERRMLPTSSGRCCSVSHSAQDCSPHKKESSSYDVHSAKVEKPCFKGSVSAFEFLKNLL